MLTDPREIEIIAGARQANVRNPKRSRLPFVNIFSDFLPQVSIAGHWCLDLGPGQYDFSVLAAERGANTVSIDNDEAVLALGTHKGLATVTGDIGKITEKTFSRRFDGIFCKFSLNCFWHARNEDEQRNFVVTLNNLLEPEGWAWIAPWNGAPKKPIRGEGTIATVPQWQISAFKSHGFEAIELPRSFQERYGVTGDVVNNVLLIKNLTIPAALRSFIY